MQTDIGGRWAGSRCQHAAMIGPRPVRPFGSCSGGRWPEGATLIATWTPSTPAKGVCLCAIGLGLGLGLGVRGRGRVVVLAAHGEWRAQGHVRVLGRDLVWFWVRVRF